MNIQQSYREASVRGANAVALVVRLYEQMIEDMRQVALAIERNDIPGRSNRIKHTLLVIAHLQSTLDFERGGKVARDLENFYNALRQNVMYVQFRPAKRAATQVITDLLAVREAWIQVERSQNPSTAAATQTVSNRGPDSEFDSHRVRVDWNG